VGRGGAQGAVAVPGELHVANTLERFKGWDHGAALAGAAARVWADIASAEARPQLLGRFLLLAHADLKTYRFCYWCGARARPRPPAPGARPAAAGPNHAHSSLQSAGAARVGIG